MNTRNAVLRTSNLGAAPEGALCGLFPGLGPGWLVLRNCALGGNGPRVGLALLHPRVGVALVDLVANETDAADRFRRALDARRFPAIFGGYPPIVRVVYSGDDIAELDRIMVDGFNAQAPLALAGGDAWIGSARAAIEGELPIAAPERVRPRPCHRHRRAFPRHAALCAAAGAAAAAVLLLMWAPPLHDPGSVDARRAASPSAGTASGTTDPDLPFAVAWAEDDLTALDVADALISAERAARVKTLAVVEHSPVPAPTATADPPEPMPVADAATPDHPSWNGPPPTALPETHEAPAGRGNACCGRRSDDCHGGNGGAGRRTVEHGHGRGR
jgi:hypothetical protein